MKLLHIVRYYGPVGGMERYVWEITRELAKLGHQVQVICECSFAEKPQGIEVHELGKMFYRPRWLYYWRFSLRVAKRLQLHPQPAWLIHSHERVGVHHVTTFHGPPFASVREKPWWKKISLRVAMQLYMERRELRVARFIVPNSRIISRQLGNYYPEYACKLTQPVVPGVLPGNVRVPRIVPQDGGVLVFAGYEWKRKGLLRAIEIAAWLRRTRPNLQLWMVGPDPVELEPLFAKWTDGYRLLGWQEKNDYLGEVDVLLHPALAEPYGMVIAEAMAARVPVVISDVCGAAEHVTPEAGTVLPLSASIEAWAHAVEQQLNRSKPAPQYDRSWATVAQEYEQIYREILKTGLK